MYDELILAIRLAAWEKHAEAVLAEQYEPPYTQSSSYDARKCWRQWFDTFGWPYDWLRQIDGIALVYAAAKTLMYARRNRNRDKLVGAYDTSFIFMDAYDTSFVADLVSLNRIEISCKESTAYKQIKRQEIEEFLADEYVLQVGNLLDRNYV